LVESLCYGEIKPIALTGVWADKNDQTVGFTTVKRGPRKSIVIGSMIMNRPTAALLARKPLIFLERKSRLPSYENDDADLDIRIISQ
jgi:hypothetical protein